MEGTQLGAEGKHTHRRGGEPRAGSVTLGLGVWEIRRDQAGSAHAFPANACGLLAPGRPVPPALLLCWPLLSAPPSASPVAESLLMRTNILKQRSPTVTPEKASKPQALSSGPCEPHPPTKATVRRLSHPRPESS